MSCLVQHWFPNEPMTEKRMGEALYMERRYWENMKNAISSGIKEAL